MTGQLVTGQLGLVVVLLVGAAVTVGWPVRAGRTRQRAVLDPGPGPGSRPTPDRRPASTSGGRAAFPTRPVPDRRPASTSTGLAAFRSVPVRRVLPAAALLGGGVGAFLGGPVAALALAVYGTLAARAAVRRRARQAVQAEHRRDLDRLGAVAADLRAGLPTRHLFDNGTGRIARLTRAAVRLADRTGAPLADLLDRIEADARAADRGLAAAAAQAAGARATAWLLAALPLGGIGLGYAIGVDPVAVLLHTPVGGGSAVAAVALQVGGLLWAERLGAGPGRAA
ncbi:type II secretion system F family protein [Micromonospora sp. RP3T]|uniref:type II secretion system F family protein n=1 Tax=Micromonospora sp. RP3T TaxID=2135446 RepID=UPI003D73EF23